MKWTKENFTLGKFTWECLTNDSFPQQVEMFKYLWENSTSILEFQEALMTNEELRLSQATAKVLESNHQLNWYFLRSFLGDEPIKTLSDCGGVKIGNDDFSFIVSNGMGDGETRIAILERDKINRSAFDFITSIEGKFNIYNYDCGNEIKCSLNGRFGIYSKSGFVIFEKWD